mmetsp:Transcript_81813/g.249985  ORF Transcript_81813/g.249985 Transcript_81813/m.249985 type:complete len:634 (-) Transcript_81813:271-2172(-)
MPKPPQSLRALATPSPKADIEDISQQGTQVQFADALDQEFSSLIQRAAAAHERQVQALRRLVDEAYGGSAPGIAQGLSASAAACTTIVASPEAAQTVSQEAHASELATEVQDVRHAVASSEASNGIAPVGPPTSSLGKQSISFSTAAPETEAAVGHEGQDALVLPTPLVGEHQEEATVASPAARRPLQRRQTPAAGVSAPAPIRMLFLMRIKIERGKHWAVRGKFEILMNALVVLSAVLLYVDVEIAGLEQGAALGLTTQGQWYESASNGVAVAEHVFNAVFIAELALRLVIMQAGFFVDKATGALQRFEIFDLAVVVLCSIDLYFRPYIDESQQAGNLTFIRLFRVVRMSRAVRVLRVSCAFSKLRVLLGTVACSLGCLLWSMVLMFLLMYGASLCLCQSLLGTIGEEGLDPELVAWLYKHYGTSSRAMWTMFELTFSGGWPNYVRRLVEEVHMGYAFFFAIYVTVVVFAITRIITALFLKDTLQTASEDHEMMLREQQAKKEKCTQKLKGLFSLADTSGDGMISLVEFKDMLHNPAVVTAFASLDLQVEEVMSLFHVLDDGDGMVSYDEFCKGILRMKGAARSTDICIMMHDCGKILKKCGQIEALLGDSVGNLPDDRSLKRGPTFTRRAA